MRFRRGRRRRSRVRRGRRSFGRRRRGVGPMRVGFRM